MPPFEPVAKQPDHIALEHRVLERWERERTFETLRDRNRGGPPFSFIDGPITANNPMGVHHGWGRTLKDVWQRYYAMQGHDLLYQNGFDCQGLWVEVGVEKELGLNSKREIEAYGLDRFARACRDRVALYAGQLTEHSKRLGQWMDWERSYYTMTDPNISYIWGFLKECHEREWLYRGHRSMPWCPRCGTSLSQHELIDSYKELTHPSLHVRLPLQRARPRVPGGVDDDAVDAARQRGRRRAARTPTTCACRDAGRDRLRRGRGAPGGRAPCRGPCSAPCAGPTWSGSPTPRRSRTCAAQIGFENRVVAWEDVSMDEGTGIVHIAPGCGEEDFELGRREGLETLIPVDEAGAFTSEYGWLHGHVTAEAAQMIVDDLGQRGRLVADGEITHRYPVCWRCGTELIYRLVDEWFIRCEEIRQPMIDAARGVEWTPRQYGKRMEDWLVNMGDWCISRKRYWGLPLPFYFCDDGHMTVIGSQAELLERALRGIEGLEELHRPWIDDVVIGCGECGGEAHRLPEVGDCWLDAGIVPFSTLGWRNDAFVEAGYAAGAGVGVTIADLPDHAFWEKLVPGRLGVGDARADSALVLLDALHGRRPRRPRALPARAHLREGERRDRPAHAQVVGQRDLVRGRDRGHGRRRDAVDVRRPAARPEPELRLRPRRRGEERRLLKLWNTYSFFVLYANIEGFTPELRAARRPGPTRRRRGRSTAGSPPARSGSSASAARRSTRGTRRGSCARSRRSWTTSPTGTCACRGRASGAPTTRPTRAPPSRRSGTRSCRRCGASSPVMPFLTDEMWQNLVRGVCAGRAAGHPPRPAIRRCARSCATPSSLAAMESVRAVVELGRRSRDDARIKLRQPLREVIVATDDPAPPRRRRPARRAGRGRARGEAGAADDVGRGVRPGRGDAAAQAARARSTAATWR